MARQITVEILGNAKEFTKATHEATEAGGHMVTTLIAATAAAGAALVGFGLISLHSFVDAGKAAEQMSKSFGMSASKASGLTQAAALLNINQETLTSGLTVLTRTLGNMDLQMDASGKAGKLQTEIFKDLKIKIYDTHGALKPMPEILSAVADRFKGMKDGTEKTIVAMKLFGKSAGPEMIPFLNQGSAGIAALMEQAKKYGAVLTDEDVKASHDFELKTALLHVQIAGITNTIGRLLVPAAIWFANVVSTNVLPAIKRFSDWFVTEAKPKIQEFIGTFQPQIVGVVAWIKEHWPEISTVIGTTMGDVKVVLEDVVGDVGKLAGAIQGLQGNSSALQGTMSNVAKMLGFLHNNLRLVATAVEVMTAVYIAANVVQGIASVIHSVHAGWLVVIRARTIAVSVATWIWTAAQAALNLVMSLNPIALVILGIALLIGGIVFLVTHLSQAHAWFSNLWAKITNNPIGWLINTGIAMLINVFKTQVMPVIQGVIFVFQSLWQWAKMIGDIFGTVVQRAGEVVAAIRKLPGFAQAEAIAGFIGHIAGSGRAAGGPVVPGGIYTVGEAGPETLVMGSGGGMVIPNGGQRGGGVNVYINIAQGAYIDGPSVDMLANRIALRLGYATGR